MAAINTKKTKKANVTNRIKGTVYSIVDNIRRNGNLSNLFLEAIHNSIEHANAKHLFINIDNQNRTIVIKDDGCGMSLKNFEYFINNFTSHMVKNADGNISLTGKGIKEALIWALNDDKKNKCVIKFRNGYNGICYECEYTVDFNKTDDDIITYGEIKKEKMHSNDMKGFGITINNTKFFSESDVFGCTEKNLSPFDIAKHSHDMYFVKKTSQEEINKGSGIDIVVTCGLKTEHMHMMDPLFMTDCPFKKGENINKIKYDKNKEAYRIDPKTMSIWHFTKKKFVKRDLNNKIEDFFEIPLTTVYLSASFVTNAVAKDGDIKKTSTFSFLQEKGFGIYPKYGNTYIELGSNTSLHIGKNYNNAGHSHVKVSFDIPTPKVATEIFGVKDFKNTTLESFHRNSALNAYKCETDGGKNLYEIIDEEFVRMIRFHIGVQKQFSGSGVENIIKFEPNEEKRIDVALPYLKNDVEKIAENNETYSYVDKYKKFFKDENVMCFFNRHKNTFFKITGNYATWKPSVKFNSTNKNKTFMIENLASNVYAYGIKFGEKMLDTIIKTEIEEIPLSGIATSVVTKTTSVATKTKVKRTKNKKVKK